ncbi:hypothetical protein [Desulfovibrio litoralis]|uniref:Uncharacterized protein n=1 Tax=Desulfovibrio litoralis DSM 11393 TaxID=1121455 RepID=A0A1M7S1N6_9BACT|nr:hypothetical protein [Desulfovibrio litoralis]SHN52212.1 hypothetical protein SAMN02745728_00437 [Desulfovibrio litoralis DSM 11393]
MEKTIAFKDEYMKRFGKKYADIFKNFCGQVLNRIERDGVVIQEQKRVLDEADLIAYLLDEYNQWTQDLQAERYKKCKGRTVEDVMLSHALGYTNHVFITLGEIKAFTSGDFNQIYRFLGLFTRYYYASNIHNELIHGGGYASGSGIDHGGYGDAVSACFALMRPDWAKCFYPKELGLIKKCHRDTNRIESLVAGILHDNDEWKEKAYKDAQIFLKGKRSVSVHAAISYLCNLYDADTSGMSSNLAVLMKNYHKTPWLTLPGGYSNVISLYGYYLMGKTYLSESDFAKVERPAGSGWWNEYIDVCLQNPPTALDELPIIFPEPLGFLNEAMRWIEQGPPLGTVRLAMDIPRENRR